ncbi:MAG: hypothetical protein ACJ8OJ_02475 [Povalibacter sp.]
MNDSNPLPRWSAKRFLRGAVLLSSLHLSVCSMVGAAETAPDSYRPTVLAVWKPQEIGFHFQSFTTFYSCQALEDRIRMILLALGAGKDIRVRSSGCEMGKIAKLPFVRIRLSSPVEATPQVLEELKATRSTRELTARVRGERAPDDEERFDAYWKPVSLFRSKLRLDPGDCALVEQLQREVFPKLAVRVTKDQVNCMPNQVSMTMPRMELEALVPVEQAAPKDATEKKPGTSPQ